MDEVKAVWFLGGGSKIVKTKSVRSRPGQSKRVGFSVPAGQDQIDLHQSLGYGDTCKVTVTTVQTFGQVS